MKKKIITVVIGALLLSSQLVYASTSSGELNNTSSKIVETISTEIVASDYGFVKWKYNWYFKDANGENHEGWLDYQGKKYYCSPYGGELELGWVKITDETNGENTYYFTLEDGMLKGFTEISGKNYYFNDDGIMVNGWFEYDGKTYHQDSFGLKTYKEDDTYHETDKQDKLLPNKWIEDNGNWKYANSEGVLVQGWQNLNGNCYYFDKDCNMLTGNFTDGNKYYLSTESGALAQGEWYEYNGEWFYIQPDGSLKTGWFEHNNKWYCFSYEGKLATNEFNLNGCIYGADSSGALLHDCWAKLSNGQWGYANSEGKLIKSGWINKSGNYYAIYDFTLKHGKWKIDGAFYFFNSDGVLNKNGWVWDGNAWNYSLPNGELVTYYKQIDGEWYFFDEYGDLY